MSTASRRQKFRFGSRGKARAKVILGHDLQPNVDL